MHLVSNPTTRSLDQAAGLTAEPVGQLRARPEANVGGGAAVLRAHADTARLRPPTATGPRLVPGRGPIRHAADDAVARLYADHVYDLLGRASRRRRPPGSGSSRAAGRCGPSSAVRHGRPRREPVHGSPAAGGGSRLRPGPVGRRQRRQLPAGRRPGSPPLSSTSPRARTPAPSAGSRTRPPRSARTTSSGPATEQITQMVGEKDTAWHARDWPTRTRSASSTRASSTTRPGSPTRCTARRPR